MHPPIEIDAGKVNFSLENLQGCFPFDKFIDFCKQNSIERLSLLKDSDPNRSMNDLAKLQKIHQTIKGLRICGTEAEKIAAHYWLSSLFLLYLKTYHLDGEDSLCRLAWVHLLKLRYHSLITLLAIKESSENGDMPQEEDILRQLPIALREWRTFCQNPQNHFLFQKGHELGSPEEEMWKIIHGEDERCKNPHSFFVKKDSKGREPLRRRFISDWFLNDRYDWIRAFRLCCHYWKVRPKLGFTALGILPVVLASHLDAESFQASQWLLFILSGGALFIALFSEPFTELLVPRLWAAVAVGYVPTLMTREIWKASLEISWTCIGAFCVVSFILSFLYLRWEIGNRMRQTPELKIWVPIRRALVLVVIGIVISLVLGLLIFDSIGDTLIKAYLDDGNSKTLLSNEYSIQGVFGKIYPKMLLTFMSIALLFGVVLQIFWHEKPVTAPV